jgi:Tfp pilus assembly protein PilF
VQKPFSLEQIRSLVRAEMDEDQRTQRTAGDYDAHLDRARELIREGHVSAAEEHVAHAIHADRSRPDAYNVAGVVALLRGDRPAAQRQWRIALTHDPAYAPAQKNLSVSVRVPSPDEPLDLGGTRPEGGQ